MENNQQMKCKHRFKFEIKFLQKNKWLHQEQQQEKK